MQLLDKVILNISALILSISPGVRFTEGVVGQPDSFFPSQAQNRTDKTISSLIFRGLFKYDIYGTLIPDLADSWIVSEDGIVYTITIKSDQKWSDGSTINADDLIYTAFKTPTLAGIATDKVDDRTVRYTLPNKFSPFLSIMTIGVMKSNSEENQNKLNPVTSADFRVISVKRGGPVIKEVTLYNQNKATQINKLVFRYYANDDELELAAKLGEIDGFVSASHFEFENYTNKKFPIQSVYYSLMFNLRTDTFKDVEFRRKLRASLPIDELIQPYGIPVEGAISKSIFTKESVDTNHFDKALASEVIQKKITITVPNLSDHKDVAKKIKNIWENKFGLDVQIREVDPSKIMEEVLQNRDFEILLYGQEVGRDPDRYVNWHSTQKEFPNLNLTGFEQVKADRALEEGRNAVDYAARLIHYNVFQDVMESEVPAIFLYHPYVNYYISKYIDGIGDKYTFTTGDRFLDFYNWKRIQTN
ncbi:ABC transporter substrate-binding protein [candidate division WWE3 bacterium]|nr:ABC transporter substrate-binding protein [candidate division WWE3 bacterium]